MRRAVAWLLCAWVLAGCALTPLKGPRADAGLTDADAQACAQEITRRQSTVDLFTLGQTTDGGKTWISDAVQGCMAAKGYTR